MFEITRNEEIERLIAVTKSDSGITGPELAEAHFELGKVLAQNLKHLDPEQTTVVAVLRGGIFFASGIYFELGCRFDLYDPKANQYARPATKNVIVVDSVINTGRTIEPLIDHNTIVACCVINQNAISKFENQLYTIRVSNNSFIGSNVKKQSGVKGPDTTLRLFNQL